MAVPKKGEGWGLVGCSKEGQVQGIGGQSKGFGSGRVGVLFFESWRVDLVTCSSCCLGVREGLAWRGKGSGAVPGGVGGRGTGPRDGANFATCVVFLSFLTCTKKEEKLRFLKDGWLFQRGASPGKGCRKGRCVIFRKLEG